MTASPPAPCETPKVAQEVNALGNCAQPTALVVDDPSQPIAACHRTGGAVYVLGPVSIRGDEVKLATAQYDASQGYLVVLSLTSKGSSDFARLTAKVSSLASPLNQVATVVDGVVESAPTIEESITGGSAEITGGDRAPFTKADVTRLAEQINAATTP
jgi:preprotein translocase subunit SecD